MRRIRRKFSFSDKKGSILLTVLTLIIVISFMLTRFVEKAQVEVESEGFYFQRSRLRMHAWSMLEVAVAVLADVREIDQALYDKAQGWDNPLEYAQIDPPEGMEVTIEFIDESAKLNINDLDEGSLFLLFDEMGFNLDVSQKLTNTLLDWIDEDDDARIDGAESREYSSAELEMHPPNTPLRSLMELKHLIGFRDHFFDEDGIPNSNFRLLSEVLTYHSVTRLNVNTANPLALTAFAGLNDLQIESISTYRAGIDGEAGTSDDNYFASTEDFQAVVGEIESSALITHQISVMTIKVTIADGGNVYSLLGTLNAESQAGGDSENANLQYPFLFLEVREELGPREDSQTQSS